MVKLICSLVVIALACWSCQALPGGWSKVDVSDAGVQAVANFSVNMVSMQLNTMYSLKLVRIEEAKVQVVAGLNYNITFFGGLTVCRKGSKKLLSECEWNLELKPTNGFKCNAVVYRMLDGTHKMLQSKCSDTNVSTNLYDLLEIKPQSTGSWQQMRPEDDIAQKMARAAVSFLSVTSDAVNKLKLVHVVKADYQIVSGVNYHLVVDFGKSNCLKTDEDSKSLTGCKLINSTHVTRCHVIVYSVPWLEKLTVSEPENCQIVKIKHSLSKETIHQYRVLFEQFKAKYVKQYGMQEEEEKRFKIFSENQKHIKQLNDAEQGSAKYGNTLFADLTVEEFKSSYLGFNTSLKKDELQQAQIPYNQEIPTSFDWREKKAVSEVKNQGSCGSCWAFSTTGNIEGQWAIKKKSLVSLSEQELVDCDTVDQGCNGGLPSNAYKQIMKLGGLETETQYPYDGVRDKCSFSQSKSKVFINGSVAISKNETEMAQWLVKNGPISIGINAFAMQFYFGGVSHPFSFLCSPASLDHGVLIVGYGVETTSILKRTLPYWIVKNSWGGSWGESGYYRVYRGDGTCGLNRMATSAVIN